MADIVNLRMRRKRKEREDKEQTAMQNRARYGRTKSARQEEEAAAGKLAKTLDNHLRIPGEGGQ